jgi:hypothetical protein
MILVIQNTAIMKKKIQREEESNKKKFNLSSVYCFVCFSKVNYNAIDHEYEYEDDEDDDDDDNDNDECITI